MVVCVCVLQMIVIVHGLRWHIGGEHQAENAVTQLVTLTILCTSTALHLRITTINQPTHH